MNSTRISFKDFMEQNSQQETQREKTSKQIYKKPNKETTQVQQNLNKQTQPVVKIVSKKKTKIHNVSVQIRKNNQNISKQKKKSNVTISEKNRKSFDKSFSSIHNHLSIHEKAKSKINPDSQFLQQIVYALDKTIKNRPNKATSYLNKVISYIQYLQCLKLLFMIPEFYQPNPNGTDIVSKFWTQYIAKHTIKNFVQKISLITCINPPFNKCEQEMILLCQPLKKNREITLLSYQYKNRKNDSLQNSSNSYDTHYEVESSVNLCMVSVGTFQKQGKQECESQDIENSYYDNGANNQRTSHNQINSTNQKLTHDIILFEGKKISKHKKQTFIDKQNQNCMINMSGINNFQLYSRNRQTNIPKQINSTFVLKSPVNRSKGIQQQFLSTLCKQKSNRNVAGNLRSEKLYQIAKSKSINKLIQMDKSTDQVQYQKNREQLTFQPNINISITQKKKQTKKSISQAQEASIIRMIKGRVQRQIRKQLKEGKIPFDEKIMKQLRKKKFTQYYNNQQNTNINYPHQGKSSPKEQIKQQYSNQQQGIVIEILLNDRSQNLIFNYKRQSYEAAARKFIEKHNLSQSFYLEKLIEGIKKAQNYCMTKIEEEIEDAEESDLF